MLKNSRNTQRYINAMESFDLQQYLETGTFSPDTPEELQRFTKKIVEGCLSQYEADIDRQQDHIAALQSQINPHFLYNTLDNIRSEALLNGNMVIEEMTECLSRFFRYTISNRGDMVSLRDEILNLKDYFFIQQYRFGKRFSLDIKIQDNAALEATVPKMILQPLVENALYHGLESKKEGGCVTIHHELTSRCLYLWVSDNGIGMPESRLDELNDKLQHPAPLKTRMKNHKSIAMTNIHSRIRLHFGSKYGIRVSSVENRGTDVEVRLPYLPPHTTYRQTERDSDKNGRIN